MIFDYNYSGKSLQAAVLVIWWRGNLLTEIEIAAVAENMLLRNDKNFDVIATSSRSSYGNAIIFSNG
jgi:hypothetical protein